MRIAVITPGAFSLPSPRSSSVEQVVHEISQNLKEDINYFIFSKRSKTLPIRNRDGYIRYYRIPFKSRRHYLQRTVKPLRYFKPQIIQVENRPRYVLYYKKRFKNSKIWLSLHSTKFMSPPHISRETMAHCLRKTDRIMVNSHFLAAWILERFSVNKSKIFVNHLGTNLEHFQSIHHPQVIGTREEMRNQMHYANKNIILYVGRLLESKGIHLLLQALPYVIEQHPNTVCLIVGSAYYGSNKITNYVKSLHRLGNQMPNHVKFIPFVPHTEIKKWYYMSDIVVVPSQGEEAFGLTNVEAMASGLPVIATRTGGISEIVLDGETGFLVDGGTNGINQLSNKIIKLLYDSKLRKTMGEGARKRVEQHFTWSHTAARIYQAYKEEVSGKEQS